MMKVLFFVLLTVAVAMAADKPCFDHLQRLGRMPRPMVGVFVPKCDDNGHYSSMQCHGSVCYCARKDGKNIGYENGIWESQEKSCNCARDADEYRQTGMLGRMFRCDKMGNYSPLQCHGSACFCVDKFGKKRQEIEGVHISQSHTLKC